MRGDTYIIKIDTKICICRKWNLIGISCAHAISTTNFREEESETYLAYWYKNETYLKAYTHILLEVVSSFWDKPTYDKLLHPPICKKVRRRP